MSVVVKLVETDEEKLAVYRFRYQVYVEEMNRKQLWVDHEKKVIIDPLDKHCYLFGAFENGNVVGTVRFNLAKESVLEYPECYDFHKFGKFYPEQVSMTTKMMVAQAYRKGDLSLQLAQACYPIGRQNNIQFDFIDTNSYLVPFFTKMG